MTSCNMIRYPLIFQDILHYDNNLGYGALLWDTLQWCRTSCNIVRYLVMFYMFRGFGVREASRRPSPHTFSLQLDTEWVLVPASITPRRQDSHNKLIFGDIRGHLEISKVIIYSHGIFKNIANEVRKSMDTYQYLMAGHIATIDDIQ